ncbi:hypothetical protein Taro_017991 [Colocasia esculenta]|uniref:Uncharacterized protein n=1 Tax=Colocasia esculenta TaxID=4460 RepID=A0A843UPK9_COLES|nr:hypothetical protein [Colocasia esculenta]
MAAMELRADHPAVWSVTERRATSSSSQFSFGQVCSAFVGSLQQHRTHVLRLGGSDQQLECAALMRCDQVASPRCGVTRSSDRVGHLRHVLNALAPPARQQWTFAKAKETYGGLDKESLVWSRVFPTERWSMPRKKCRDVGCCRVQVMTELADMFFLPAEMSTRQLRDGRNVSGRRVQVGPTCQKGSDPGVERLEMMTNPPCSKPFLLALLVLSLLSSFSRALATF